MKKKRINRNDMNRNYHILSGALLLFVSGVCFQSCQQDDFVDSQPDIETLIAEGRYFTARSEDASEVASDTEEPKLFEVGTPYRLFAFTKAYQAADAYNETPAGHPRFNKVAWEGETTNGLRFINIDSEPDKWFGFSALDNEDKTGTDGLVSLDFYGFTYGKNADHTEDYIPVDGWTDSSTQLKDLKHTSNVENGELEDLKRGVLLNQNIQTAGKSKSEKDNVWTNNAYTQSVMPFKHCFSKLRFQVSQQSDEDNKDDAGNPILSFPNLYVDKIEVINTYSSGDVYLQNGKIKLTGNQYNRDLSFKTGYDGKVTEKNTDVGNMIIFPSDGGALTEDMNMPDGYDVGLRITVRSTEEEHIKNMVRNTNTDGNESSVTSEIVDGTTWYKGTIVKKQIVNYDESTTDKKVYLHFKQNTSYILIIAFKKDAVRIITVIPQVEKLLPGEGTPTDPWQDQAMGQPQMFDNIVWSDRNLGADHYDATGSDYEKCVGYFYQAGRNIPYYPFLFEEYNNKKKIPDPKEKIDQDLANRSSSYGISKYRFFPMVDSLILRRKKIIGIGL
ncbi:hypothetical protein AB9N12_18965 [Bacteroides sp. AN502(2024)]|uniref:hypothetical protein n=1 Tax=Bacteroides sp. AN502(2024) TaxID=3160599 RepID=UPI003514CC40